MKLHEWQAKTLEDRTKDILDKSLKAGASEEAAIDAAVRFVEGIEEERKHSHFIREMTTKHGASKRRAEELWRQLRHKVAGQAVAANQLEQERAR